MDDRTSFADACRDAGLAFMRGTAEGWSRRELAMWLVGKYGAVATKPKDKGSVAPPSSDRVKSEVVSDVLREARWKVFAELEEAAHGTKWIQTVVAKGLVARDDKLGWVPVDRPGARLRSRVLSLFAVDAMLRPNDYKDLLFACPRCESIVFDESAKMNGRCCGRKPAVGSGVRPRLSDFRRSIPPAALEKKK